MTFLPRPPGGSGGPNGTLPVAAPSGRIDEPGSIGPGWTAAPLAWGRIDALASGGTATPLACGRMVAEAAGSAVGMSLLTGGVPPALSWALMSGSAACAEPGANIEAR